MASFRATKLLSHERLGIMSKDDAFLVHCGCEVESEETLNFYSPHIELWSLYKVSILSLERSFFPFREQIRDYHEFLQNFGILLE
jgi:hypothetical protein